MEARKQESARSEMTKQECLQETLRLLLVQIDADRFGCQLLEFSAGDFPRQGHAVFERMNDVVVVGHHQRRHGEGPPLPAVRAGRVQRNLFQPHDGFLRARMHELGGQRGGAGGGARQRPLVNFGLLEQFQPPLRAVLSQQIGHGGEYDDIVPPRRIQPGRAVQNQAQHPLRMTQREIQSDGRAHRDAADHRLLDLQVIHQRQQIIGKGRQADFLRRPDRMRPPMRAAIKSDQPNAARRTEQAEGLRHVRPQSVLKEKGDAAASRLIIKVDSVVREHRGNGRRRRRFGIF